MKVNYNDMAREIHADNGHWWSDPATGQRLQRNRGTMFALMHSELSEALEGIRKDLMDDHLPHRKTEEVELADFVIRALDYIGSRNTVLVQGYAVNVAIQEPAQVIADLHRDLSKAYAELDREGHLFSKLLATVEIYSQMRGFDLWGAVAEKREYNRHREDHKPEARLAAGGKKF
jgi:hypothetical protein